MTCEEYREKCLNETIQKIEDSIKKKMGTVAISPKKVGYNQHTSQPMLLLEKTQKREKVMGDNPKNPRPKQATSPRPLKS